MGHLVTLQLSKTAQTYGISRGGRAPSVMIPEVQTSAPDTRTLNTVRIRGKVYLATMVRKGPGCPLEKWCPVEAAYTKAMWTQEKAEGSSRWERRLEGREGWRGGG